MQPDPTLAGTMLARHIFWRSEIVEDCGRRALMAGANVFSKNTSLGTAWVDGHRLSVIWFAAEGPMPNGDMEGHFTGLGFRLNSEPAAATASSSIRSSTAAEAAELPPAVAARRVRFQNDEVPYSDAAAPATAPAAAAAAASAESSENWGPIGILARAAGQKQRYHRRRSGYPEGTFSVDLSGPHNGAPIPGFRFGPSMAKCFIIEVYFPPTFCSISPPEQDFELPSVAEPQPAQAATPAAAACKPLVYLDLLKAKSEACTAIVRIVSRIRNEQGDGARLYSDRGSELMNNTMLLLRANMGLCLTSTQGYDSNDNGHTERHVGPVKLWARSLLLQSQLSVECWGWRALQQACAGDGH